MNHTYYLLWATGEDKPGIVASVTEVLFRNRCNLEDSSMMKLGSEFGILLIFSSVKKIKTQVLSNLFTKLKDKFSLDIGLKPISKNQATFTPLRKPLFSISVHGADSPGIVHGISDFLYKNKFNILDLETHRTTSGKIPGYILFIEGEFPSIRHQNKIRGKLKLLEKKLNVHIQLTHIPADSI